MPAEKYPNGISIMLLIQTGLLANGVAIRQLNYF